MEKNEVPQPWPHNSRAGNKVVTSKLGLAIAAMSEALQKEFHQDYAFVVMGQGEIVAASNLKHGIIVPKIADVAKGPPAGENCNAFSAGKYPTACTRMPGHPGCHRDDGGNQWK